MDESAKSILDEYFEKDNPPPLRVYIRPRATLGNILSLQPGSVSEHDAVFQVGGYTVVINKRLQEQVGSVSIEGDGKGFALSSERPLS